ncbi:MAG: hypothetical protein IT190_03220 [Microbacteriaceae bacterium]|nr:hypothetical protein [Microbacteriaceae bacterium]
MSEVSSSNGTPVRRKTTGADIAALVFGIVLPVIGLVLALVARSTSRRQGRASSSVAVAALVVSSVLTGLWLAAGIVATVFIAVLGQPFVTDPARDSSATIAEAKNSIVLEAGDSRGSIFSGSNVEQTKCVLAHRLDRARIGYSTIVFTNEKMHVIFADDADADTVARAASVLAGEYRLDLRGVVVAEECPSSFTGAYEDVSGQFVACDSDRTVAYTMGPVEVAGDTIIDAMAAELPSGVSNGPWAVNLLFDAEGTRDFAQVTTRLIGEQPPRNMFAMVLDGEVITAPVVMAAVTDGKPQITGEFDRQAAESLAYALRLASRDVTFVVKSTTILE